MRTKGFIIVAIILVAALGDSPAVGQTGQSSTLDSLVNLALERNPMLAGAKYRVEANQYRARSAGWLLPDPQVMVEFMNLPAGSLALDRDPMSGVTFGLTQMIPWPGMRSAEAGMAQLEVEHSRADVAFERNALIRMVTMAYTDYSFWDAMRGIFAKNRELLENLKTVAETRYANGQGAVQDVLVTETAIARLENKILDAEQQKALALSELGRLINTPEPVVTGPPAYLSDVSARDILLPATFDGSKNPLAQQASLSSEMASSELAMARSRYWPELMLGVGYTVRQKIPMVEMSGEDMLTFRVGFSVPLWFFKRQKPQSAAAYRSIEASKAAEESVNDELSRRYTDATLTLKSLAERIGRYDRSIVPQANSSLEASKIAYEVGRLDFSGLLEAHMNLLDIEMERLDLLRDLNHQRALLQELQAGTESR